MATKLGLDTHNQKVFTGIGAELGGIVASGTAWIEALRAKLRLTAVTSTDGWARTWASRAIAAAVRAFLVMILIVAPSVILPGIGSDTKQIVALLALFGGALVFFEYHAIYPSLIEFRDGAPYNRIRYLMMLTIVVVLSSIVADREASTTVSRFFHALGLLVGASFDFPYSPVRLASYMLDDTATAADVHLDQDQSAGPHGWLGPRDRRGLELPSGIQRHMHRPGSEQPELDQDLLRRGWSLRSVIAGSVSGPKLDRRQRLRNVHTAVRERR